MVMMGGDGGDWVYVVVGYWLVLLHGRGGTVGGYCVDVHFRGGAEGTTTVTSLVLKVGVGVGRVGGEGGEFCVN